MIIAKFDHLQESDNYHILIHVMEGEIFPTVYKNGEFYHRNNWTEREKELFQSYVSQGAESPQYPKFIDLRGEI